MVGSKRQMHGITAGVSRHQPGLEIKFHNLDNGWFDGQ